LGRVLSGPTAGESDRGRSRVRRLDSPEEEKFNEQLDAFANREGTRRVWRLSKKYENHLRKALGEKKYQELCQKYSLVEKPTRARLIATEAGLSIPEPVEDVLRWLANKPV
jgi:hypothetical protein